MSFKYIFGGNTGLTYDQIKARQEAAAKLNLASEADSGGYTLGTGIVEGVRRWRVHRQGKEAAAAKQDAIQEVGEMTEKMFDADGGFHPVTGDKPDLDYDGLAKKTSVSDLVRLMNHPAASPEVRKIALDFLKYKGGFPNLEGNNKGTYGTPQPGIGPDGNPSLFSMNKDGETLDTGYDPVPKAGGAGSSNVWGTPQEGVDGDGNPVQYLINKSTGETRLLDTTPMLDAAGAGSSNVWGTPQEGVDGDGSPVQYLVNKSTGEIKLLDTTPIPDASSAGNGATGKTVINGNFDGKPGVAVLDKATNQFEVLPGVTPSVEGRPVEIIMPDGSKQWAQPDGSGKLIVTGGVAPGRFGTKILPDGAILTSDPATGTSTVAADVYDEGAKKDAELKAGVRNKLADVIPTVAHQSQTLLQLTRNILATKQTGLESATGNIQGLASNWKMPFSLSLNQQETMDARGMIEQVRSNAFNYAFQSLKGGGQVTEKEGILATEALARLDYSQSEEQFKRALLDLNLIVRASLSSTVRKARNAGMSEDEILELLGEDFDKSSEILEGYDIDDQNNPFMKKLNFKPGYISPQQAEEVQREYFRKQGVDYDEMIRDAEGGGSPLNPDTSNPFGAAPKVPNSALGQLLMQGMA